MIDSDMQLTNGASGEIHIVLDTSEAGDSETGISDDLKLWLGSHLGEDDEPTVWLVSNDSRDRHKRVTDGSTDRMWSISTARLRAICDMVDAMHKVGRDQFRIAGCGDE